MRAWPEQAWWIMHDVLMWVMVMLIALPVAALCMVLVYALMLSVFVNIDYFTLL
ncbi:hypothetical protein [Acidithiobacillus thiooxidans]|uniref:hypothetical protein n=1 Tax=Acidithiobacillus thiooxidans TaxID=930 RepID=UPI0012D36B9D|nr:hypothetical protein [Acidithiobacillus thiooxidans]